MRHGPSTFASRAFAVQALSTFIVLLCAGSVSVGAVESYERAFVDKEGQLHIITTDHRGIIPPMDKDQVGFEKGAISEDRRAAGWLALYPNCCTSYPIPLKLVIYANGETRPFTGNGLMLWKWRFEAHGKQVAFRQETVHFGLNIHYELRDWKSGRLVGRYDPIDSDKPPPWVKELDAQP